MNKAGELFGSTDEMLALKVLLLESLCLAKGDAPDLENIHELGEGWVAEETLAIAVYCACKYSDDFEKAMIASANHSGDSDSTAAVTGNILGAYLGIEGIPEKMVEPLELKGLIIDYAKRMHINKLV